MRRGHLPRWAPAVALVVTIVMVGVSFDTAAASSTRPLHAAGVPHFDHVFLVILENNGYNQIIGNRYAPVLNALARDYGVATDYRGVADPSEPNYIAMLGGSYFGISNDNPYWFPGNTVHAGNLMSQLQRGGESWKGYFQGMPYAGYRGYCYPDKCNGIPDADTQYVSKHNGIVNFANLQTPAELAHMVPFTDLTGDLARGTVPNFSYIVPDECDDMHGAPPWCVDSGAPGTVQQDWLIAHGDAFIRGVVTTITSAAGWRSGQKAIVVTFDEGNSASSKIATIVVVNHGPRGLVDPTPYSHYSLLATLEQAFGLGCLLNSCHATLMGPLFAHTGSRAQPTLPAPYPFPTGPDQISAQGLGSAAAPANLTGATGWSVVPSADFGKLDNVLDSVSAGSATDAWAVGTYYPPSSSGVLAALGEHWDGTRWTAYPLPDVGVEQNTLFGVSMPSPGKAWAVGYYLSGKFLQRTLIEHFDGTRWIVVPSPDPSAQHNILYGVSAFSDTDVWAVGASTTASAVWQTLIEHWDGTRWSIVPSTDPGPQGDELYAVSALGPREVYAVGQQAGTGFPSEALVEHWGGSSWRTLSAPRDPLASALPLAIASFGGSLTIVGQQENDTAGYAPYTAGGAPRALALGSAPGATPNENDLFGVVMTGNDSGWAVGWAVDDTLNDTYLPLILHENHGTWSVVRSPGFGPGSVSGLAAISTIPGGGMWAVGETSTAAGNPTTLVEYHP